jgi:hypothetical protein
MFHGVERYHRLIRILSDFQVVDRHEHTGARTFPLGDGYQLVSDRGDLSHRPSQRQIRGVQNIFRIIPFRPGKGLDPAGIVASV